MGCREDMLGGGEGSMGPAGSRLNHLVSFSPPQPHPRSSQARGVGCRGQIKAWHSWRCCRLAVGCAHRASSLVLAVREHLYINAACFFAANPVTPPPSSPGRAVNRVQAQSSWSTDPPACKCDSPQRPVLIFKRRKKANKIGLSNLL